MKKLVTYIEHVEGRETVLQNGVSFPVGGKGVIVDSSEFEMSPWFEGNASFTVEDINETTETESVDDDAVEDRGVSVGSEDANQDDEATEAVKPVPVKRTRKRTTK